MNKISEKAVWDELIPPEDEKETLGLSGQSAQPPIISKITNGCSRPTYKWLPSR